MGSAPRPEPQGDIGKLVMELLRTMAFDATLAMSEPDADGRAVPVDAGALNKLALAIHRLETAGRHSMEREKAMQKAAREAAAEQVAGTLKKAGMSADLQQKILRDILGVAA